MTRTISHAIDSLKSSIETSLDAQHIHNACRTAGHRWRERTLNPVRTIWLFALQILHGNTACMHTIRLMRDLAVTDSGYCQARARIPLAAFRHLFLHVVRTLMCATNEATELWCGHRVFLMDASNCSMPDTPALQKHFGQPKGQKPGCGFPIANLVTLFRASSQVLVDWVIAPLYSHEAAIAHRLLEHLKPGDVLVADRGLSTYSLLGLLARRRCHAVMRLHQKRRVEFPSGVGEGGGRCVRIDDRIVQWERPQRPKWMSREMFDTLPSQLTLRQARYRVEAAGYRTRHVTLITTLLDHERYPLKELARLYGQRWQVETNFRHIKQTMRMDVLRCKSVDGVQKELWMFAIVYNLVRAIMVAAAKRQGVTPDRISFIDVLRWLMLRRDGDEMPRFVVNRLRPGRHQPRAVKRRPKSYKLLTIPRSDARKALCQHAL